MVRCWGDLECGIDKPLIGFSEIPKKHRPRDLQVSGVEQAEQSMSSREDAQREDAQI